MSFTEYPGFRITRDDGIKRPKGVPRRKKPFASRGAIMGDAISVTEHAIWLNPRYRTENSREIRSHLGYDHG